MLRTAAIWCGTNSTLADDNAERPCEASRRSGTLPGCAEPVRPRQLSDRRFGRIRNQARETSRVRSAPARTGSDEPGHGRQAAGFGGATTVSRRFRRDRSCAATDRSHPYGRAAFGRVVPATARAHRGKLSDPPATDQISSSRRERVGVHASRPWDDEPWLGFKVTLAVEPAIEMADLSNPTALERALFRRAQRNAARGRP